MRVLMPSHQDARCPPAIELYKIRREALCENNPSSQHYNKTLTLLRCESRRREKKNKTKKHKVSAEVLEFGPEEEKLIMRIAGTNRTELF